jgi:hypothetical protein
MIRVVTGAGSVVRRDSLTGFPKRVLTTTTWQDGVCSALASVLGFLDSEPLLARMWLVESLAAGPRALERRERNLGALREQVLSSWPAGDTWTLPPLAAEGAMASVLGIIHPHIVTGWPTPLIELLGPLMGLLAAQYLPSPAVALEIRRGEELARARSRPRPDRRSARAWRSRRC